MKILLRFILVMIITLPIPLSCDYTEYPSSEYSLESLGLKIAIYDSLNSNYTYVDLKSDFVNTDSKIKFEIYPDETSAVSQFNRGVFWQNTLYADPVPPYLNTTLDKITISANSDIIVNQKEYMKNENLNDLFYVSKEFIFNDATINDFIIEQEQWFSYETIILDFRSSFTEKISTKLNFQIIMSDGKVFELQTPILNFN